MKAKNPVGETVKALDGLIQGIRTQLEAEPPKPTVADYLRLVQLRLELGKGFDPDTRPINVRWVEDQSTPEPDPDPLVPWPGDESLT